MYNLKLKMNEEESIIFVDGVHDLEFLALVTMTRRKMMTTRTVTAQSPLNGQPMRTLIPLPLNRTWQARR